MAPVSKMHHLLLLLSLLLTLACAGTSSRQIANLQQDLARERELIRELRSDMQRMLTQFDLLVDMLSVAQPKSAHDVAPKQTTANRKTCTRRGSDTRFECHKDFVDYIFNNAKEVSTGARIIPSIQGRKLNGFRFNFVEAGSVIAILGLLSGDVVHSLNGQAFHFGNLVSLQARFRHHRSFTIAVTRGARRIAIRYIVMP